MNRFYLYFLNLRVWLVRRRLREMGFCHLLDEADARTVLQLTKESFNEERAMLEWIKIGLAIVAILSMWLMFLLRIAEPVQIHVNFPTTEQIRIAPPKPNGDGTTQQRTHLPTTNFYSA